MLATRYRRNASTGVAGRPLLFGQAIVVQAEPEAGVLAGRTWLCFWADGDLSNCVLSLAGGWRHQNSKMLRQARAYCASPHVAAKLDDSPEAYACAPGLVQGEQGKGLTHFTGIFVFIFRRSPSSSSFRTPPEKKDTSKSRRHSLFARGQSRVCISRRDVLCRASSDGEGAAATPPRHPDMRRQRRVLSSRGQLSLPRTTDPGGRRTESDDISQNSVGGQIEGGWDVQERLRVIAADGGAGPWESVRKGRCASPTSQGPRRVLAAL